MYCFVGAWEKSRSNNWPFNKHSKIWCAKLKQLGDEIHRTAECSFNYFQTSVDSWNLGSFSFLRTVEKNTIWEKYFSYGI